MKRNLITAGVDEVGRGCLAGPVVSAAVILNENINSLNYNIETVNKMVYIIGISRSENERKLVINTASEVYGVEEVIDYISIKTDEF